MAGNKQPKVTRPVDALPKRKDGGGKDNSFPERHGEKGESPFLGISGQLTLNSKPPSKMLWVDPLRPGSKSKVIEPPDAVGQLKALVTDKIREILAWHGSEELELGELHYNLQFRVISGSNRPETDLQEACLKLFAQWQDRIKKTVQECLRSPQRRASATEATVEIDAVFECYLRKKRVRGTVSVVNITTDQLQAALDKSGIEVDLSKVDMSAFRQKLANEAPARRPATTTSEQLATPTARDDTKNTQQAFDIVRSADTDIESVRQALLKIGGTPLGTDVAAAERLAEAIRSAVSLCNGILVLNGERCGLKVSKRSDDTPKLDIRGRQGSSLDTSRTIIPVFDIEPE